MRAPETRTLILWQVCGTISSSPGSHIVFPRKSSDSRYRPIREELPSSQGKFAVRPGKEHRPPRELISSCLGSNTVFLGKSYRPAREIGPGFSCKMEGCSMRDDAAPCI